MKKYFIVLAMLNVACTKVDYKKVYPVGTEFNYNAGDLKDLIQYGHIPVNPFIIDSIDMNLYAGWAGYKVKSSNNLYYDMSNSDIKEIK